MTKTFFFIISILLTFSFCTDINDQKESVRQRDALAVKTIPTNDSIIEIQARLIDKLDTIKLPAYCGTIKFDITLKYEVINVIKGKYADKTILIYHICPREIIEQKMIENDKVYTYKLKRRFELREIKVGEKIKSVDAGDYEMIN